MTETEAIDRLHREFGSDAHFTVHHQRSWSSGFQFESIERSIPLTFKSSEIWTVVVCDKAFITSSQDESLAKCVETVLSKYELRDSAEEKPPKLIAPSQPVEAGNAKQAS